MILFSIIIVHVYFFFFFSSRRRHTRLQGDWSSDVCSSDLPNSPYTWPIYQGAWGIDVRNADGLIVISDLMTGFWAFKMDGFDGWNGHQWGMPNVSSAQDWDHGPEGAPKPQKVS